MEQKTFTARAELAPAGMDPSLVLDGFEVRLCRSELDGRVCVIIDSHDAGEDDTHEDGGVPKVRLVVNGDSEDLDENGTWRRFHV